ncbi:hypothetical protein U1769_15860 [Sphingomonas sp. ZT3P38]|uniref:hypothetical protein n=1 Tax=Parasphingomonas zepuensis TaxID=3096161 RepID=UPI002FC8A360
MTSLTGQRIVDFCDQFDLFCDRITRASPRDISFVDARRVNLGNLTVRGVDIEVDYRCRSSTCRAGSMARLACGFSATGNMIS